MRLLLTLASLAAVLTIFVPAGAAPAAPAPPPPQLAGQSGVIAAGRWHTCAITSSGTVTCWGANSFGQLGDGTTADSPLPVAVQGLGSGVHAIATGERHTCAVHLGSGSASLNFPNIRVGGDQGFGIEGAKARLEIKNGAYFFSGAGTFVLPGVGAGSGGCKVGTSFTLASTPPPLREASLSISGCAEIPIGNTGFFLTGVRGTVSLDEGSSVAIDLGIDITGGPDVPGLGPALSGSPSAHWDNSWKVGLSGTLKVFNFDVADAALTLSRAQGLEGQIRITMAGVVEGQGNLRIASI